MRNIIYASAKFLSTRFLAYVEMLSKTRSIKGYVSLPALSWYSFLGS